MSNFKRFAEQVSNQFQKMSITELYTVGVEDELEIWNLYLDSFPEGTNEIYRERRYYDGSYDRNVIRQIGHVVAIAGDKLVSIWDTPDLEYPFNEVAEKIKQHISSKEVVGLASIALKKLGHVSTIEILPDGTPHTWHHFHAVVENKHLASAARTEFTSSANTNVSMFLRSLESLKPNHIETVLGLIETNAIYRGAEFKTAVTSYKKLVDEYNKADNKILYLWTKVTTNGASRLRSAVIGTLIEDLDEFDEETAIKRYEAKVAPANYKRPTALITAGMVKSAVQTMETLGLEDALERRHAEFRDVSVNDVIWVNGSSAKKMKGAVESLLADSIKTKVRTKDNESATEITIEEFIKTVAPTAENMELAFTSAQKPNLVSITAPVRSSAPNLFKWDNPFAWSYIGGAADSFITERVKSAGGNVNALLRVSLAWFNTDDLDIHARTPNGHVCYSNKLGILDIDANSPMSRHTSEPVENMQWTERNLLDGLYMFKVYQYTRRNSENYGFTLEVASSQGIQHFHYKNPINTGEGLDLLEIVVKNKQVVSVKQAPVLSQQSAQENIWGITTGSLVQIESLMLSPNHWSGNNEGNKHFMFILKDCKNPDTVRGFYNEYLRSDLDKHRKVFEVLGSKTKAAYSEEQLSGVGFSSTRSDEALIAVTSANSRRIYKVKF